MLEFELFRIQVYPNPQQRLFELPDTPQVILRKVIDSLPEARLRKGLLWHVGNVEKIDNSSLYFRLGRTTASTREIYVDGKFEDRTFEEAPYTHVLLDLDLELCAIAKKPRLGAHIAPVARQLARLLKKSLGNVTFQAEFEVKLIPDPSDFVTQISKARTVSKFWVTFSKPNAMDADKDFMKPMQKLLAEAKGDKGKTEIEGQNLGRDNLVELAKSAASIGNDAGAIILTHGNKRKVRKSLTGNPVTLATDVDISETKSKFHLMKEVREAYNRVRDQ